MHSLRALACLGALLSAWAQLDDLSLVQRDARTGANRSAHGELPPGQGHASGASGRVKTWMLLYNTLATTEQLGVLCRQLLGEDAKCKYSGHPDEGGLPIVIIRATQHALMSIPALRADHMEEDGPVELILPVQKEENYWEVESWALDRINARKGMDGDSSIVATGEGVDIFSFDTGVTCNHPDFGGRAIPAVDFTLLDSPFGTYLDCSTARPEDKCASDKNGHGTHTAGLAASNKYGVATKATVHAVKVLSDSGSGMWSWFVGALDWAIAHVKQESIQHAVITASLGGHGPTETVTEAINSCTAAGIAVVVAAGNDFSDACSTLPAQVPAAITVGSTDEYDSMSYFSNYGPCVDVFAPGSHILSLGIDRDGPPVSFSGTSMAAPLVAGAVALIFAENPDATPELADTSIDEAAGSGCLFALPSTTPNKFLYVGPETDTDCSSVAASGAPAAAGGSLDMAQKSVAAEDLQEEWLQAQLGASWRR